MEGSDESGVVQRIQSSFGNNCSSSIYNKQSVDKLGINGQMQNLSVVDSSSSSKRPVGIPPSHPHSHSLAPKIVNPVPGHSRSFDQLPPLSPSVFREPAEDKELPPRRGHRRSSSDIPLKPAQLVLKREAEVVDDLFSAYMNLDNLDALQSSSMEDSRASGTRTNESSENEVESSSIGKRGKRSARHFRSLSMDSFMGNLNFSDESSKPGSGIRSPSSSFDGSLEFANSDFSPAELKKIMANGKLAEIAMSDPKRVKRILANRQSAARSKERKLRYIAELEHKVQTLQTEATALSAQLTLLQRDSSGLTNQNNELRFRIQAMEQQALLREALNEALTSEVQRLKLVSGEIRGEMPQHVMTNNQMLQMQPSHYDMYQLQQLQLNRKQQQTPQRTQEPQESQSNESQQEGKAFKS